MPKLYIDIPHVLGQDEALRRLKAKFAAAKAEHQDRVSDYKEEWQEHIFSFGFKALGMAVSGTVAVEPKEIKLAAQLPLAAMLMKSTIEEHIRREVDALLSPRGAACEPA